MAHVGFGVWGRTVSKAGALSLWFQWFLLSCCNYQAAFLVFSVLSSLLDTRKWSCVIWLLFLIRVLVMIWQVWIKTLLHHFPATALCSGVGDSKNTSYSSALLLWEVDLWNYRWSVAFPHLCLFLRTLIEEEIWLISKEWAAWCIWPCSECRGWTSISLLNLNYSVIP